MLHEAKVAEQVDAKAGLSRQDLVHLLHDPLAADLGEHPRLRGDRPLGPGLDLEHQLNGEANRAQQPQRILGEPFGRIPNRPNGAGGQVALAAERVDDFAPRGASASR